MPSRYFALIPAAGHSIRMGRPKLLLPLAERPLIAHTLAAWQQSRVDRIFVVVRKGDDDLASALRAEESKVPSSKFKVDLVIPEVAPPDMKASVQAALKHIEQQHQPAADDAVLVAPADMPRLSPAIIDRLIEHHTVGAQQKILVPTLCGQRGHPVLFPWPLTPEVFQLSDHEGLNAIVDRGASELLACDDLANGRQSPFADIDTPEQFRQLTTDHG